MSIFLHIFFKYEQSRLAVRIKTLYQVASVHASERTYDFVLILSVIPEEIFALSLLFLRRMSRENPLAGIRMDAGVVDLGGESHRRRRKVLHLLKVHIQILGLDSQFGHISLVASRMARYKIGYDLLAQPLASVYTVEYFLKLVEKFERWLSHEVEYLRRSVFRRNLEPSRNMACDQFFVISAVSGIDSTVATLMHRQVIAYSAAYKSFLYARHTLDGMVNIEKRSMVVA